MALTAVAASLFGATAFVVPAAADPPSADLSVTASHSPSAGASGTDLTFTITAHNDGPDPAAKVLVALASAFPLTFVSDTNPAGTCTHTAGSPTSSAVVCDVGDLASGASATVTVVLMPLASGIYQIPVVTSSDTADPDAADRIVTDTVIVKKGPSQAVRYIHGLFKLLLGRDASAGDATYWSAKFLKASYFQRYEIPLGVMASKEYRAIRIKEAYLRILERAASPDDVDFSAALIAKGETYAHLERRLVASAEFATHHPGTAIVDAIFKVVLRRPPNQSERSHWADALSSGRRSVDQMTAALQTSNESFELIMRTRLKEALDRAPFALDRFSWQLQLRRGVSPERLYADTLGGEFLQKFPPTYDNIGCCFYGAAPTL